MWCHELTSRAASLCALHGALQGPGRDGLGERQVAVHEDRRRSIR